jgi:hypothetical protein
LEAEFVPTPWKSWDTMRSHKEGNMGKFIQALGKRRDLVLGLLMGGSVGWAISAAPVWARATTDEHWWEVASAIGTVAAAAVAGWLGLREGWIRQASLTRKAAYARTALWPEFREYLAAIERLQQPPDERDSSMAQLLSRIDIESWVRELVRDLPEDDVEAAANVLAQLHHARRHLVEITDRGATYPFGPELKVESIKRSLRLARNGISPLVARWRKE